MPLIILVGGGSGAGKTTFALELAKALGEEVTVLNIDRYYIGLKKMEEVGLGDNFDDPRAIDWERLVKDVRRMRKMKDGEKLKVPVYDFKTHSRVGEEELEVHRVVVVDGLWVLLKEELRKLADLKVYLDVDADLRLVRRIKRDIEERGRDLNEVIYRFTTYVKPMHEKWVEPTKKFADIVIPRGGLNRKAVEVVASWILEKLTSES